MYGAQFAYHYIVLRLQELDLFTIQEIESDSSSYQNWTLVSQETLSLTSPVDCNLP
jgi:hypothetical protein